jgi:predicted dehydrogenase
MNRLDQPGGLLLGEGARPSHGLTDGSIKVGVVGLGSFGRHHAKHYAGNPRARLVAVADQDADRGAANGQGAPVFSDYRDLIGKVDAVSIAVPATDHAAVARDFVEAGVHVLIEKPIAIDVSDARDLIVRADRRGVVLQVGHVERFSPAVAALQQRLTNPRRLTARRKTKWSGRSIDVDVVLDLMIHDIDLVLTLAGAPVASVAASGASVASGATDEAEAWLTFANGAIATLSASRVASEGDRRLVITEPDTVYAADLSVPTLTMTSRRVPGAAAAAVALEARDNLGAEIEAFLSSIAGGTSPLVDGKAGLAALDVAQRIRAAIAEPAQIAVTA